MHTGTLYEPRTLVRLAFEVPSNSHSCEVEGILVII
jgi:hypothetical protein